GDDFGIRRVEAREETQQPSLPGPHGRCIRGCGPFLARRGTPGPEGPPERGANGKSEREHHHKSLHRPPPVPDRSLETFEAEPQTCERVSHERARSALRK